MNKKGQELNIGGLIMVAIAVIVGAILFTAVAGFIGQTTTTGSENNTYTPAADGSSIDLLGQELLSTPIVINQSSGNVSCADNYTIAEGVSPRTGTKRIIMTTPTGNDESLCTVLNISYDYAPEGYIDDSAGRAVAPLILIFMALAIAITALVPTLRSKLLDEMGK